MLRISIFGMDREIGKDELVSLTYTQNGKGLISKGEFWEEFIPLYCIGRRDHVKGAWIVRWFPRVRKRLIDQGQAYIEWDVRRVED